MKKPSQPPSAGSSAGVVRTQPSPADSIPAGIGTVAGSTVKSGRAARKAASCSSP